MTLGYAEDGKRRRRKVSGQTKGAVVDKLRELHTTLDKGIVSKTGYANYTMSLMSHHGVSIEEIARLAGHASIRTTEVVYHYENCDR